jgi:hypothetical protein
MNKAEARELLAEKVAALKSHSYAELRDDLEMGDETVVGPSGKEYRLEVEANVDEEMPDAVWIIVSIDDGGWWSTVFRMTDDFIMASDDVAP